mgnify:CR=1 FL=1
MVHVPLAADRREQILELLRRQRAVRISELAEGFGVSPMTVRRDIEALEADGVVERVHGGARLPLLHDQAEPEPQQKALLQPGEKHAIARAAADLVVPGTAVGIGSGTTTLELARVLAERDDLDGLTIVTNALAVAEVLDGVGGVTVVLIGGVRTISGALVGPIATSGIRQLNLHTLVIGCHGIDPERGATAPNLLEAETNRAFMAQAATTVVLADATKWGIAGLATFAAFDEIDVLVTDESLADAHRHDLAEHVERVLVVDPASGAVRRA